MPRSSAIVALRLAPEDRVLRLAGDELFHVWKVECRLDPVRRPLTEAEGAHLALADDLGQRLHCLLERRVEVVAMALVDVDVVGAEAEKREIELLEDLPAREAAVAVHREIQLRPEDVRGARPPAEDFAEERLGGAA